MAPKECIAPPSLHLLGTEPARAAMEYAAYHLKTRGSHRKHPQGDGHPVIIFPGLASNGAAVAPLRKFCTSLGYAASDWGRGFNTGPRGDLGAWLEELADHTATLLKPNGRTATLIGWSLGGLYARQLGKLLKPYVRQVITVGTPFNASGDHTRVGWLYRLLSGAETQLDANLSRELRTPPSMPTTSIYSRSDGIVAWETCRHDRRRKRVEDIEIQGSHIGMGWNPAVLDVIADRLAQQPGGWTRYAPQA
jgi:hypothetical protein